MPQMISNQMPTAGFAYRDFQTHKCFQALCQAVSNLGKRIYVDNEIDIPEDINFAAAASFLVLLGVKALFWTDLSWNSTVVTWLQLHSGYTLVSEPCLATCALITRPDVMPPLDHFRIGENKSPADAAVLVIQLDDIYENKGKKLIWFSC